MLVDDEEADHLEKSLSGACMLSERGRLVEEEVFPVKAEPSEGACCFEKAGPSDGAFPPKEAVPEGGGLEAVGALPKGGGEAAAGEVLGYPGGARRISRSMRSAA